MKKLSRYLQHIAKLIFLSAPCLVNAAVITNGLNGATANFFAVDVNSAGSSEEVGLSPGAQVTNPSEFAPQGIIYLYNLHIIVNGTSSVLTGTAPSYVGPATDNKVTSSGNFVGSEGNTIEWTVDSSIQSGAVQMRNIITFTAVTGTLGDLQVIQYMDQDVDGANDDVFFTRGTALQGNIELFTLDDNNPNNVGVSQGGAQLEEQGLINASFDGWGACVYGERDDFTDGSTTYSKSGVICPTLNNALPKVNHPVAGSVSASADIITTMSWTVNKNSNQSVIVSTLGGVPDAGVALAIDDYINIVENTSTLESITFDALANDVALDIPVTFLKTSDPSDGSISLNGSVITYTPDLNYFGQDSFTYSITDNSGDSDTATIYLNVEEDTNANGVSDAEETAALEVVKNYADNGTNPKPSEITYSNLPTTGVMASNIVEINVAIESLNLVDVDTVAEIQAVIDQVISDLNTASLAELVEDLNGNANATSLTLSQLKNIVGVVGVIDDDLADYNAAFVAAPSPFADIDNPTVAEINAVIASVNAINELVEDLNGDANATVLTLIELKAIQGTEDIIDANMSGYNTAFVAAPSPFADINNPTVTEINAVIDEVNSDVAIAELVEDLNGDANATALTAEQLKDIQGIVGVVDADIADYNAAFVAAPSPFADIDNPTVAEINAVIASVNAINELVEDLNGDTNATALTSEQLKNIEGVTGVVDADIANYNAAFVAAPSQFADINNPTVAEINAVIASVNAINELVEDLNGDANATVLTLTELKAIQDVEDIIDANMSGYNTAFVAAPSPFLDINNPTIAEINAVIDEVNSDVALAELVEDLNGDTNSTPLTAEQLKNIEGVTGVVDADIANYNAAFIAAPSSFADIDNPTVAEINAVIASVNAINELVEDLNGDANSTVLTLAELKAIQDVEDIIDANMSGYNTAFVAAPSPFVDINNPTVAEINAVIASVNAVTELVDDLNGDGNSTALSLVQLQSIQGVESIIDAEIDAYNAAFIAEPSPFVDINNPTVNEVQAVIDAINVIVANEVAAIEELKEDIASNSNNDLVEATELNAIRGVDGALTDNQADYQAGFIETNPSPFADTNNPTAEEIQAVIDSVNVIVANETAVFAELIEDIAGDTNNGLILASDLNSVRGISGAVDENQEAYQKAFTATTPSPFSDPRNPTAAEVQAVIAAVNNGGPDTDGDGMPDSIDNDDDNDGLLDIDETDIGRINPDQDADGICDGNLAVMNTCVAGPDANPTNPDSDGNGICDGTIAFPTTNDDSGCMPSINLNPNADSDNDGITDDSELIGDSDGDLIPDYLDADANGTAPNSGDSDKDGIDDSIECGSALPCRDSDKDGIYDHLDTDSDNDGISDDEEADGIAGNGEDLAATDGSVQPKDTDKDGKPDYRDEDSDNDGIADRDEVNQPHNPLNPKDSDNDGIPDLVDHDDRSNAVGGGDSDNDGLSDAQECPVYPTNCPDTDGDGKADYLDNNKDSDGDGIADNDEDPNFDKDNDPATNPRDTDGDGIPDYLDDDSDNDGVKDSDERNEPYDANNPRDTDGDGIPDVVDADDDGANGGGDSDGDGIPDNVECSSQPCRDTDGDGIPDYTDTDSDNDGFLDADEVGANPEQPQDTDGDGIPDIADKDSSGGVSGGDSDGDGIPDAIECDSWPNCIDSDNDGLADYLDNDRPPVIVKEFGEVKTGVQGAGSLHWALSLMLLLLAMRRKSTALIVVPLMATALNVNAAWWDEMDLYAGAGIGQSYLTPNLGRSGYSIDDHTENAWKLTAGWDWNDHISIEGYYSDLGRVSLKPGASIGYRMMGGDAILHYWAYGEERIEGSIALYAKGGLNHMTNNGKQVSYEKNNTLQIVGGVGAEYYLPHKFSVRFEIESYDADASLFSLNLVKRFGFNSRKTKNKQPITIVKPVPKTVVPLAAIAPVIIVLDTDADGLLDDKDQCPNTPPGITVNEVGCAKVKEEMGDLSTKLQFESNSASLTESSKVALNEVATLLAKYNEVHVQVQAHSDNTGSAIYNKKLSQKRAESVVQYLAGKNIDSSRLTPIGYGEEQPIADNNSPVGRATNRRVEFVLK